MWKSSWLLLLQSREAGASVSRALPRNFHGGERRGEGGREVSADGGVVGSGGEMRGSLSCHVPGARGTRTLRSSGCSAAPARHPARLRAAPPGPGVSGVPGIPGAVPPRESKRGYLPEETAAPDR